METQEIQAKQQAELHTQLWAMANDLLEAWMLQNLKITF